MEMLAASAWSEATAVMAVLGLLLLSAALLSYFVVAPEYEKRLNRQFQEQIAVFRRRQHARGAWDMEAGSSDDDARLVRLVRPGDGYEDSDSDSSSAKKAPKAAPAARSSRRVIKMHASIGPGTAAAAALRHAVSAPRSCPSSSQRDASRGRLTRRRKSESDAVEQATVARADMLRRRVLLRGLEREIERSKLANDGQAAPRPGSPPAPSEERLEALLAHPADCEHELAVLAAAHSQRPTGTVSPVAKRALRTMHDVLALHLSLERRDVNKVTVFCNALLKHDGLNKLRALEASSDADVRALATAVIEKAVPAIWH